MSHLVPRANELLNVIRCFICKTNLRLTNATTTVSISAGRPLRSVLIVGDVGRNVPLHRRSIERRIEGIERFKHIEDIRVLVEDPSEEGRPRTLVGQDYDHFWLVFLERMERDLGQSEKELTATSHDNLYFTPVIII